MNVWRFFPEPMRCWNLLPNGFTVRQSLTTSRIFSSNSQLGRFFLLPFPRYSPSFPFSGSSMVVSPTQIRVVFHRLRNLLANLNFVDTTCRNSPQTDMGDIRKSVYLLIVLGAHMKGIYSLFCDRSLHQNPSPELAAEVEECFELYMQQLKIVENNQSNVFKDVYGTVTHHWAKDTRKSRSQELQEGAFLEVTRLLSVIVRRLARAKRGKFTAKVKEGATTSPTKSPSDFGTSPAKTEAPGIIEVPPLMTQVESTTSEPAGLVTPSKSKREDKGRRLSFGAEPVASSSSGNLERAFDSELPQFDATMDGMFSAAAVPDVSKMTWEQLDHGIPTHTPFEGASMSILNETVQSLQDQLEEQTDLIKTLQDALRRTQEELNELNRKVTEAPPPPPPPPPPQLFQGPPPLVLPNPRSEEL
eukprot:RCo045253